MAKAGLAVPSVYGAKLSNTRQHIERQRQDSTSQSEAASAASVSDDTPDQKTVPALVVRQSIDAHSTRGGGGLRFWNREMASDQMSSSRSNTHSK